MAFIARPATRQPSISVWGSWRMISRSLQVPGSPSSAFTTRYLGLQTEPKKKKRNVITYIYTYTVSGVSASSPPTALTSFARDHSQWDRSRQASRLKMRLRGAKILSMIYRICHLYHRMQAWGQNKNKVGLQLPDCPIILPPKLKKMMRRHLQITMLLYTVILMSVTTTTKK